MSSALMIASLAAALLAQADAAQISQIGGGSGSAATVAPLEASQPDAGPSSSPASAPPQIGPTDQRSSSTIQLAPAVRDASAADQLGKRDHSTGAAQLTRQPRTAAAPPALSSVREGHVVSTVVVYGHDRCNPTPGQALPADCARIVDQRPDDFAPTPPPELSPDELLLAGSPPSSRATRIGDVGGPEGGEEAVSAALAGVVTQTLPSATSSSPTLGTSINTTLNAPASSLPINPVTGAPPGSGVLPGGIVVTVNPAPK